MFFHIKNGYTNESQFCVILTLIASYIFLALIKDISFRGLKLLHRLIYLAICKESERLLIMPAGFHLEVFFRRLLEGQYNTTETFRKDYLIIGPSFETYIF